MDEMTITNISRSSISGQCGTQQVVIQGESYLPGYGSPDFVAYASTLTVKAVDGTPLNISESDKASILKALSKAMSLKNKSVEIEP